MTIRATALLALCASAAAAQPAPQPDPNAGAAATLEQLAEAMRDAARALTDRATPWAEGLGALLADPGAYDPPETLPNGDILIRRRTDPSPRPETAPSLDPDAPALDL